MNPNIVYHNYNPNINSNINTPLLQYLQSLLPYCNFEISLLELQTCYDILFLQYQEFVQKQLVLKEPYSIESSLQRFIRMSSSKEALFGSIRNEQERLKRCKKLIEEAFLWLEKSKPNLAMIKVTLEKRYPQNEELYHRLLRLTQLPSNVERSLGIAEFIVQFQRDIAALIKFLREGHANKQAQLMQSSQPSTPAIPANTGSSDSPASSEAVAIASSTAVSTSASSAPALEPSSSATTISVAPTTTVPSIPPTASTTDTTTSTVNATTDTGAETAIKREPTSASSSKPTLQQDTEATNSAGNQNSDPSSAQPVSAPKPRVPNEMLTVAKAVYSLRDILQQLETVVRGTNITNDVISAATVTLMTTIKGIIASIVQKYSSYREGLRRVRNFNPNSDRRIPPMLKSLSKSDCIGNTLLAYAAEVSGDIQSILTYYEQSFKHKLQAVVNEGSVITSSAVDLVALGEKSTTQVGGEESDSDTETKTSAIRNHRLKTAPSAIATLSRVAGFITMIYAHIDSMPLIAILNEADVEIPNWRSDERPTVKRLLVDTTGTGEGQVLMTKKIRA